MSAIGIDFGNEACYVAVAKDGEFLLRFYATYELDKTKIKKISQNF
jgi:molecular chaperone DnaK (HSP70)